MTITKDMVIGQVIRKDPSKIQILMEMGMPCVGCPASQFETLEEAAQVHDMDIDKLMERLNEIEEED